jgi:hypothetical protein
MPQWQDTNVTRAGFVPHFPGLLTTPMLPIAEDIAVPYFAEFSGVFGIQMAGVLRFQLKCTGPCKLYIAGMRLSSSSLAESCTLILTQVYMRRVHSLSMAPRSHRICFRLIYHAEYSA